MGNAVHIPRPAPGAALDEPAMRHLFGRYWNEDMAMRFCTLADGSRWVRVPATPFKEAHWVRESAGVLDEAKFDELVELVRDSVDRNVPRSLRVQASQSVTRLQVSADERTLAGNVEGGSKARWIRLVSSASCMSSSVLRTRRATSPSRRIGHAALEAGTSRISGAAAVREHGAAVRPWRAGTAASVGATRRSRADPKSLPQESPAGSATVCLGLYSDGFCLSASRAK
jgi:hypothetical protein